ncbi:hypothetical protein MLD38_010505 [Melastoma candidum]|uniref:Uncharacterized protein n=1 Tax=Melastoma candidum TaxID=119954 RepID=A0ACB9R1V8_9MYRT|nr:hypothetical protein MLD38_010505 [Melastoma candidum]
MPSSAPHLHPSRPGHPGEAPAAGFFEDVGEVVDGLTSCTESLGFESFDEWGVHERSKSDPGDGTGEHEPMPCTLWRKRRGKIERIRERKFPPPLTSLNDKGRPSYFLKPVRRDGRLEVSTGRLETLRASGIDGRLRLDFIKDPEFEADNRETTTDDVADEVYEAEKEEQMVVISTETLGRCHEAAVSASSRRHSYGRQGEHDLHVRRQRSVTIQ